MVTSAVVQLSLVGEPKSGAAGQCPATIFLVAGEGIFFLLPAGFES
jgi:hypothetical protein